MPIEFKYIPEHRLVITLFQERVTDDDVLGAYQAIFNHPETEPGFVELALHDSDLLPDFTEAGLHGYMSLAAQFHGTAEVRSAAVVGKLQHEITLEYIQSSMNMSPHVSEDMRIFSSISDALEHLGVDPTALDLSEYSQFDFDRQLTNEELRCQLRETQQERDETAAHYKALFDHSSPIAVFDVQAGVLCQCNDEFCQLTGYEREEILKLNIIDLDITESEEDFHNHIKRIIAEGSDRFETQSRTKQGAVVNVIISAWYFSVNSRDYIQGVFTDITERKAQEKTIAEKNDALSAALIQLQAALAERDEVHAFYQALFEQANPVAIFDVPTITISQVNEKFCQLIGYEAEEIAQLNIWDFDIHYHEAAVQKTIETVLGQGSAEFETQYKTKQGVIKDVLLHLTHIQVGAEDYIQVVNFDITERKAQERLLEKRNNELELTLTGTNCGTFQHDFVSDTIYYDLRAQNILGLSSAETSFDALMDQIHPGEKADVVAQCQHAFLANSPYMNVTCRFMRGDQVICTKVDTFVEYLDGQPIKTYGLVQDVSDYALAQELLALSQRKYQRLLDNLSDRFVAFSHNFESGEILYVSNGVESVFGTTVAAALHQNFATVVNWSPGVVEQFAQNNQLLLSGEGEFDHYEYSFIHPNGQMRYVTISKRITTNEDDIVVSEGIVEDITDRKQAEETLKETLQQLQVAIDGGKLGVWNFNPDTKHLIVSEYGKQQLGMLPDEIPTYSSFLKCLHPDDKERVDELMQLSLETHSDYIDNYRVIWPNGSEHWIHTHGRVSVSAKSESIRFIGIISDVTQQKQAEIALFKGHQQLQLAIEGGQLGIWEFIPETGQLKLSELGKRQIGMALNNEEPTYSDFLASLHPADHDRVANLLQSCTDTYNDYRADYRVLWPDGTERWIHALGQLYCGAVDADLRFIGVMSDITQQKQAEQRLARQNKLLSMIGRLQRSFIDIEEADGQNIFDTMLLEILQLTDSQYGFIDSLEEGNNGQPYLQSFAISNVAWDQESRDSHNKMPPHGMRFYDFRALFGRAATHGEVVISNHNPDDPRRKGTPTGHPSLDTFLAVPLLQGATIVGVIGLANRHAGYTEALVQELEAIWSACAQLVNAYKSKRELTIRKQRIEMALESTGCGTFQHDFANDIITYDERAQKIMGRKAQVSFPEAMALMHPDDRAAFQDIVSKGLATEQERINITCRVLKGNQVCPIKVDTFVKYENHQPISTYGLVQDISDYSLTRDLLEFTQVKYRRLVENLGDNFVVYSQDLATQKVLFLSSGFEAIFGIPASAALNQHLAAVIKWCPESLEKAEQALAAQASGKAGVLREEYCFVHPDGHIRTILITNHPSQDEHGIRVIEGIAEDITQKKAMENQLRDLATLDPLTALFNRRTVLGRLDHELHRADRYARPLSFLILDLDHFKHINDTYGHPGGDEVLKAFAQVIQDNIRSSDVAGRYGGEEFIVVMPETPTQQALELAERIRQLVEQLAVPSGDDVIRCTVSSGLATYGEATSIEQLIANADKALYAAKADGRNCVKVYRTSK